MSAVGVTLLDDEHRRALALELRFDIIVAFVAGLYDLVIGAAQNALSPHCLLDGDSELSLRFRSIGSLLLAP